MANFLIVASLPRKTATLIRSYGHGAIGVRDIGLGSASDQTIAAHARSHQLSLITADQEFGNLFDYPPDQHSGIAVVDPPARANRAMVLALVESFLQQADLTDQLPGRLAIVESGRIRLRPTP
jgi:hypothetical protein